MQVIGVRRALRFSPNNEEKDLAILRSVVAPWDGEIILEEDPSLPELLTTATVVFSMARTSWALSCLDEAERRGVCVLNPPERAERSPAPCRGLFRPRASQRRNGRLVVEAGRRGGAEPC